MAHRADPADARHQSGHLLKRTPFADFLESSKLGHVKLSGLHTASVIELNGDLGVSFQACHRLNEDLSTHAPNFLPSGAGVRCASRSATKSKIASADGGQPGRK